MLNFILQYLGLRYHKNVRVLESCIAILKMVSFLHVRKFLWWARLTHMCAIALSLRKKNKTITNNSETHQDSTHLQ